MATRCFVNNLTGTLWSWKLFYVHFIIATGILQYHGHHSIVLWVFCGRYWHHINSYFSSEHSSLNYKTQTINSSPTFHGNVHRCKNRRIKHSYYVECHLEPLQTSWMFVRNRAFDVSAAVINSVEPLSRMFACIDWIWRHKSDLRLVRT